MTNSAAYIRRLAPLTRSFTVHRISVAGLMFVTALAVASAFGPAAYGTWALAVFLAKMLQLGSLGSASGYIHRRYDKSVADNCNERRYQFFYAAHLGLFGAVLLPLGLYLGGAYFYGLVWFLLLVPLYVIEPVLRVRRRFYASLLPDTVICAASLLALTTLSANTLLDVDSSKVFLPLTSIMICVIYVVMARWVMHQWRQPAYTGPQFGLQDYLLLLRAGLPLYIGTMAFVLFLAVDRLFIERFHDGDVLGIYMLAFQLATAAVLVLTAHNFMASVDFGEKIRAGKSLGAPVKKRLLTASLAGALGWFGAVGIAVVLENYFLDSYANLAVYTALLTLGFVAFHVAGSVTPVAFHKKRMAILATALLAMVIAAIGHNIVVVAVNWPTITIPVVTCMLLVAYAFGAVKHTLRIAAA